MASPNDEPSNTGPKVPVVAHKSHSAASLPRSSSIPPGESSGSSSASNSSGTLPTVPSTLGPCAEFYVFNPTLPKREVFFSEFLYR